MNIPVRISLVMLALALVLIGCGGGAPIIKTDTTKLPVEKQDEKALDDLTGMLEATADKPRAETREVIEKGYHNIIEKYPKSYLAEESYYRLISMNLGDFDQPREEEAERLYREYFERYPDAGLMRPINFTVSRYYYEYRKWEKLVNFCVPFVQRLIETGNMDNSLCMFYYSEAHYNLKNYDEASRGYATYLQYYPDAPMAGICKHRLKQIAEMKAKDSTDQPPSAPHELPPQQ